MLKENACFFNTFCLGSFFLWSLKSKWFYNFIFSLAIWQGKAVKLFRMLENKDIQICNENIIKTWNVFSFSSIFFITFSNLFSFCLSFFTTKSTCTCTFAVRLYKASSFVFLSFLFLLTYVLFYSVVIIKWFKSYISQLLKKWWCFEHFYITSHLK